MMAVQSATELKQVLFDAYDGFADKRIKSLERDAPFIVDDRTEGDKDARGRLFLWFCQMFVEVISETEVHLSFYGGTPRGPEVNSWLDARKLDVGKPGDTISITPQSVDGLSDLAASFQKIVTRRYDTPAYKYVVPRTANSLRRLQEVLAEAWS